MLASVDLDRSLVRARYEKVFPALRERLRQLQYALKEAEIATVVLFEGWDGAGKSTMIRRLTERLDPRLIRHYPGSPPSELEKRYHFLWRYQSKLPEDGQMAFFDHSWYSRVLVERVEKLVPKKQWRQAFAEIVELERWLADDSQVLVKFFLHVSRKEQKARLRKMEKDPSERWKVEDEDWHRNRRYAKWVKAIDEMLAKTDSEAAPWTVVEAEDFRFARVKVFETLIARMEAALKRREEAPAAVSRTHAAREATRGERERRAAEEHTLVMNVAQEAGLPLEEKA